MRTLRDAAFAATGEGVADEIRARLGLRLCAECAGAARALFAAFAQSLIVAAHGDNTERTGDARLLGREWERLGKAIDVFTGGSLPVQEQTPKGQRRSHTKR